MRRELSRAFYQFFKVIDEDEVPEKVRLKIKRVIKALELENCNHHKVVNEYCERCGDFVGVD